MIDHKLLISTRDVIRDALLNEAKQREVRTDLTWIELERQAMHALVNTIRVLHGREPVPLSHIERAERMACGHSDYVDKWSRYCAEIALDLARWL